MLLPLLLSLLPAPAAPAMLLPLLLSLLPAPAAPAMLLPLLLSLLPAPVAPYKVMAVAAWSGSHTSAIWEVLEVLAREGHDSTLVLCERGAGERLPDNPRIKLYTPASAWERLEPYRFMQAGCMDHIMAATSQEYTQIMFEFNCTVSWDRINHKAGEIVAGEEIQTMLRNEEFSLLLSEKTTQTGLDTIGHHWKIPVVDFMSSHSAVPGLAYNNYPTLPFSQPGFFFRKDLRRPPTFLEKLRDIPKLPKIIEFINVGCADKIRSQFGYSSKKETQGAVKLFLTNDHVAFTWPYLRSPNSIAVGTARLLGSKDVDMMRFPEELDKFLKEDASRPVVYIGFGSYARVESYQWLHSIIRTLDSMGIRTVLKVGSSDTTLDFPNSVLPMSWIPQRDLLRSGRVKLFITHCGNNGRMEAIYYNIPLLCIPLFGDQYLNAELVKLKEFGRVLYREDVEEKLEDTIRDMLVDRDRYRDNMQQASYIADHEPSNGKKNLLYHMGYLAEHGHLNHLNNRIISQQSFIELNMLDVLTVIVVGVVVGVWLGVWLMWVIGRWLVSRYCYSSPTGDREIQLAREKKKKDKKA